MWGPRRNVERSGVPFDDEVGDGPDPHTPSTRILHVGGLSVFRPSEHTTLYGGGVGEKEGYRCLFGWTPPTTTGTHIGLLPEPLSLRPFSMTDVPRSTEILRINTLTGVRRTET